MDGEFSGEGWVLVNINFADFGGAFEVGSEAIDQRCYGVTRLASISPEIHKHRFVTLENFSLEVLLVQRQVRLHSVHSFHLFFVVVLSSDIIFVSNRFAWPTQRSYKLFTVSARSPAM